MTANTHTTTTNQINSAYETSTFALGVGITMAVIVGLWGTACLVSALASNGPLGLVKAYLAALIG